MPEKLYSSPKRVRNVVPAERIELHFSVFILISWCFSIWQVRFLQASTETRYIILVVSPRLRRIVVKQQNFVEKYKKFYSYVIRPDHS